MKHPCTASRPHVSHALRAPCLRPVTPRIAVRMSLEAKPSSEPFDRSVFTRVLTVPALRVPKARCSEVLHKFRGFMMSKPKLKCVVADGSDDSSRLVLLDERLLDESQRANLARPYSVFEELRAHEPDLTFLQHPLPTDYSNVAADEALRVLLPAEVEVPTSFETVGHIAHLNLHPQQLPYKHIIGQVLIDKNPCIRTVVNKVGSIENEFRVLPMEVVAGDGDMETEVAQHGCKFKLDFSTVYWNSRLEAEHRRLVDTFAKGQVVIDVMAGIGPFAVPAAKRGCTVLANDLNPESFRWLRANLATNKVTKTASAFNLDGRDFIRLVCATPGGPADALLGRAHDATAAAAAAAAGTSGTTAADDAAGPIPARFQLPQQGLFFHHAVMNLPALAVEFLDAFRGAFDPGLWRKDGVSLPMVHCYTFMKAPETEADVVAKVEKFLGGKLDEAPAVHVVRDVAPSKLMLCVSFRVPRAVAFCGRDGGSAEQPGSADAEVAADDGVDITISSKRQKTDQYE